MSTEVHGETYAKCSEAEKQHKEIDKVAEEHQGIDIGGQTRLVYEANEELGQRGCVLGASARILRD